ncbi:pectin lyase-like superfamily protein [Actinidia rufa]|uniref:Pectin lyase-like superfamily protein n=1 Tax=Actinidia rufa TaxID=165716 RepID=A0A7J0G220_9ERIC|nr:pectin lyase-like superfamily protein [Actinidia rufa]
MALRNTVELLWDLNEGQCEYSTTLEPRPHSVSILEIGALGNGKTLNTVAFQNAIFYLKSFADKGGAQLYVPPGKWLTGSFNLTSHLTLFLESEAIVLGSQNLSHWGIVEPLPSYGRGIRLPGGRYCSLITGHDLTDGVITDSSEHVCIENSNISMAMMRLRSRAVGTSTELPIADPPQMSTSETFTFSLLPALATGQCESHPDDKFDPYALPIVKSITFKDMVGTNITTAGKFSGIYESSFRVYLPSKCFSLHFF